MKFVQFEKIWTSLPNKLQCSKNIDFYTSFKSFAAKYHIPRCESLFANSLKKQKNLNTEAYNCCLTKVFLNSINKANEMTVAVA